MKKAPLYRRVNTTARGVHHRFGGDFRDARSRVNAGGLDAEAVAMPAGIHRGLDYTPLFRFLLSRVGRPWNEVHAEAVGRLDREAPLYWMVALQPAQARDYVRTGEATYFSGLQVDGDGVLRVVNPAVGPGSLAPLCACCTHTFNGIRFTRRLDAASCPGG